MVEVVAEEEVGSPTLLNTTTTTTTWEEEEGVEAWLIVRWRAKSPLLIKGASPVSVPGWSDRTGESTLEGEAEAPGVHRAVVALVVPATEVATVGRKEATGLHLKIGSDGIENISDGPHPHHIPVPFSH